MAVVRTRSYEFAVVGGGLAGSALAIHLAQANRNIALFEKDHLPRDKLCGEFLSPESQALLKEIGCLDEVLAQGGVPIRQARFTSSAGAVLEVALPGTGLGVSRRVLDAIVLRRAAACGATLYEGNEVIEITESTESAESAESGAATKDRAEVRTRSEAIATDCPIAAYGRFSRLDRAHDRAFVRQAHPHLGFKKHHRPTDDAAGRRLRDTLHETVEIHTFPGGYCGISEIEAGHVNVCMLVAKNFVAGLATSRWESIHDALCQENPHLRQR